MLNKSDLIYMAYIKRYIHFHALFIRSTDRCDGFSTNNYNRLHFATIVIETSIFS